MYVWMNGKSKKVHTIAPHGKTFCLVEESFKHAAKKLRNRAEFYPENRTLCSTCEQLKRQRLELEPADSPDRVKMSADPAFIISDRFLLTFEWKQLRYAVLKERGSRCECCGASPEDGVRINIDHIRSRRLFPELALVKANLQVMCSTCNHGKGAYDMTDWRKDSVSLNEQLDAEFRAIVGDRN